MGERCNSDRAYCSYNCGPRLPRHGHLGTVSDRYDVVLTNPPFGGTEGRHIQANFPVRSNATELLFVQHIMKKLKARDSAHCGMVVPEGTLFRGGGFAEVKKQLMEQFDLHTVVSLPPGTFAPMPTSRRRSSFSSGPARQRRCGTMRWRCRKG